MHACMCKLYSDFVARVLIQATKQLRSMGIRDMIVGVSSSSRGAENVQQFMEAGLDEYYTKPLTVDTLKAILDKIKS